MAAAQFDEAAGYCVSLPADFPGKSEWLGRARLGRESNSASLPKQPISEKLPRQELNSIAKRMGLRRKLKNNFENRYVIRVVD